MSAELQPSIEAAAKRLGEATGADAVVLFGSRARGDHHAASDWDLCVLLPDSVQAQEFTPSKLWLLVADLDASIQVYPIRRSVFERKKTDPNSVSYDVHHQGFVVFRSRTGEALS